MPQVLAYPLDLGEAPDLQHYMMFMINVRLTGGAAFPGTAATGTAVTPGGAGGPNRANQGIAAAVAAAGDGLQAFGVPAPLAGSNQLYRLDTAIALPVQEPPAAKYVAQYHNTELGSLGQVVNMLGGNGSTSDAMSRLQEQGFGLATRLASTISKSTALPDNVAAVAKVRTNPYKQTFFDEMDFRHFTFTFRFMPRSQQEAMAIKYIVDLFKFHMHPTLSADTAFMIFPSEFDIGYYYAGQENLYWHRISSCVLMECTAVYGGDIFHAHEGGIPAEVTLQLHFRETEVLNKDRLLAGY